MKTIKKISALLLLLSITCISFTSCKGDDDEIAVNTSSIIPDITNGRENIYLGCIEVNSRITNISVWDHGQIDGDIISIIANGDTIIDEITLDGPNNPHEVNYDFSNNGFNYVTLYAHNLGSISPNTCTIAINGVEFVLESNLDKNGSIDLIISGYGVACN